MENARTESYLHENAKHVVASWWMEQFYFGIVPVRIDSEVQFAMGGLILFIPDLVIYDFSGIRAFCEIEYTNPVDNFKLWKIDTWSKQNGINPLIIEVRAEWVMKQVNPPENIICEVKSGVSSLVITRERALIHLTELYF